MLSAPDFNTYIFGIVLQFPIDWLKRNFWNTSDTCVKHFWAQVKFSRINPKYKTKYQKADPAFIFLITLLISGDQ